MWPAVEQHVVRVDNDSYREWDDSSQPHFDVTQSIPARIANQALPVGKPGAAGEHYAKAVAAVQQLANNALDADAPQLDNLVTVLIRSDAIASSRIEQVNATSEALAVVLADLDEEGDAIASQDGREAQIVAGAVEAVQESLDADGVAVSDQWFKALHTSLLRSDSTLDRRCYVADDSTQLRRHCCESVTAHLATHRGRNTATVECLGSDDSANLGRTRCSCIN